MCNGYPVYEASRTIMMNPNSLYFSSDAKIYSLVETEFSKPVLIEGKIKMGTELNGFFLYHAYMGDCIFNGCKVFAERLKKSRPTWRDLMYRFIITTSGIKTHMDLPGCFEKIKAAVARSLLLVSQAIRKGELDPSMKPDEAAELLLSSPWIRNVDGYTAVYKKSRLWRKAFEAASIMKTVFPSHVTRNYVIFPVRIKDLRWYLERANELAEKTGFAIYPIYGPAIQSEYDVVKWLGIDSVKSNGKCVSMLARIISLIIRLFPEIHEEGKPLIEVAEKAYARAVYAGLISIDRNGIWLEKPYRCYLGSDAGTVLEKAVRLINEDDLGFLYYLFA